MRKNFLIKIMIFTILLIFIISGNVNATYQSTPYTHANPQSLKWDTWLYGIRAMESADGAFGLNESLNYAEPIEKNNIDVHMAKATEYGAVVILSSSKYGNPNNTQKPETSTADTAAENKTGVFYNYNNREYVACIAAQEVGSAFNRYWDKYNTLNLIGLQPSGWHGSNAGGNGLNAAGIYYPLNKGDRWYIAAINQNTPNTGLAATVLSVGYGGLFTYGWGTRFGPGYTRGSRWMSHWSNTYIGWQEGTYYASSYFYSRGAIITLQDDNYSGG